MLSGKSHPFIEFLKGQFNIGQVKDGQTRPVFMFSHEKRNINRTNLLKNILNKSLADDDRRDIDDKAADNWRRAFSRHRSDFSRPATASHPELYHFLKQHKKSDRELSRLALALSERSQQAKKETEEKLQAAPWAANLATSIALALILSISIARVAPGLGDSIISTNDKLFAQPVITLAYLFAGDKILAKTEDAKVQEIINEARKKIPVDKNYLISYILNHQAELKLNFEHQGSLVVSRDQLDGRVAGVSDANIPASPSPALLDLSQGKDNENEKASQLLIKEINDWLKMLEKKQIELSKVLAEKISK